MYAVIETSGCSVRRGAVQIRIDLFLEPGDLKYDEHHLWVVDTDSDAYKAGFHGAALPNWDYKADDNGHYLNKDEYDRWKAEFDRHMFEYQAWQDSLPHKWQDAPFHSHFVQLSPDVTDAEIQKILKNVADEFGAEWNKGSDLGQYWNRKPKKKVYAPFKVDAPFEALVFDALREGKTPALVGENMSAHLVRCAVKGLDIAARKDEFKAVR